MVELPRFTQAGPNVLRMPSGVGIWGGHGPQPYMGWPFQRSTQHYNLQRVQQEALPRYGWPPYQPYMPLQ